MNKFLTLGAVVCAGVGLSGCIDNNYDLADADYDAQIRVNNLVVPVNLAPVELGQVIDLNEGNVGPVTIDGKTFYAFHQDGNFNSNGPITIPEISVKAPTINSNGTDLLIIPSAQQKASRAGGMPDLTFSYRLKEKVGDDFAYSSIEMDPSIKQITNILTTPFSFNMTLSVHGSDLIGAIKLKDVRISLPKGLHVTLPEGQTYNETTGIWSIKEVSFSEDAPLEIGVRATGLNFSEAGGMITADHNLSFAGGFWLEDGVVEITPRLDFTEIPTLPNQLGLHVDFKMNGFNVESLSGRIQPDFAGLGIAPISLDGIPEFLKDPGTQIELGNPQLFLQVNDPAYDFYKEPFRFDMSITPMRGISEGAALVPSSSIMFEPNRFPDELMSFAMAVNTESLNFPPTSATVPDFSRNLTRIPFPSLGKLLLGDGLPTQIKVDVAIPEQEVTNFPLGRELSQVYGSYYVLAPLALTSNSQIIYSNDMTDWGEDMKDIVIDGLSVRAKAHNGAPVSAKIEIFPLDTRGEVIPGIKVESNTLAADSDSDFEASLVEGTLQGFEGIRIVATLSGSQSGEALSPDQKISFSDIKLVVNGYYDLKNDDNDDND